MLLLYEPETLKALEPVRWVVQPFHHEVHSLLTSFLGWTTLEADEHSKKILHKMWWAPLGVGDGSIYWRKEIT